jgi:hypothetical protein
LIKPLQQCNIKNLKHCIEHEAFVIKKKTAQAFKKRCPRITPRQEPREIRHELYFVSPLLQ